MCVQRHRRLAQDLKLTLHLSCMTPTHVAPSVICTPRRRASAISVLLLTSTMIVSCALTPIVSCAVWREMQRIACQQRERCSQLFAMRAWYLAGVVVSRWPRSHPHTHGHLNRTQRWPIARLVHDATGRGFCGVGPCVVERYEWHECTSACVAMMCRRHHAMQQLPNKLRILTIVKHELTIVSWPLGFRCSLSCAQLSGFTRLTWPQTTTRCGSERRESR
jgi:hypothetical protein